MVADDTAPSERRSPPVMGPRLRGLLRLVLLLSALLAVDSVYLGAVRLLEHWRGEPYQDYLYLTTFLVHLALGLLLIPAFLVFGGLHLRRAIRRPNRYAVRAGLGLFASGILVLASGLLLTRFGVFEVNDPGVRGVAYWLHIAAPLVAAWLFVLHRLAGPPIRWAVGMRWAGVAAGLAAALIGWRLAIAPPDTIPDEAAFATTLVRTPGGAAIPARQLMTDASCSECHADIAAGWRMSSHRLSSFNNPFYAFSVNETRRVSMDSSGDMHKARFCAGCHDLVPLLSGAFDDPGFDTASASAQAGLTCTSCHAIAGVNSVLGNADFTIAAPVEYPFEHSDNALLRAIGHQLIKAKPDYHRRGFLKPMHSTAEFCGACHKAHVPAAVNDYKWLRVQNHYDSFVRSGVSGHRVDSFYYPDKATTRCAACHMPLIASDDPAARDRDGTGTRTVHSHLFPAANTGLAHAVGLPDAAIAAHRRMLEGAARIDIFGVRAGGEIDGPLQAPLDAPGTRLEPGQRYLVEAVVRNLRVGHELTQGTADSNELWVELGVRAGGRLIGRSGALGPDGRVDPWSYFVNSYVLTKDGERLDRRNGQDTFVALYNHQIPPGAAAVVHYLVEIPADVRGPITIEAALRYRKFDTTYLRHVEGERFAGNDLPIVTIASDRVSIATDATPAPPTDHGGTPPSAWERWNDYGIGLLLSGSAQRSALRQAEQAFAQVEALGRPDGPLNLARVYLKEGRIDDAAAALERAATHDPGFRPWTRAWLTAQVDRENGHLDQAATTLRALRETRFAEARSRGFDFARDYRVANLLGRTLYEQSRREHGDSRAVRRRALLGEAREAFLAALAEDPEDLTAHFNLALVYADLGDDEGATRERTLVERYRPDDHAVERAVATHRRHNPAADHAAEAVAIYDLQRPGTYGLDDPSRVAADAAQRTATPEHRDGQGS